MAEERILVGIQILNFNGSDWLREVLPTLADFADQDSVVYLLDNASTDDSISVFRELMPAGKVIHMAVNCGFSPAYNLSIDTAWADGCSWVCLLNNDIHVSQDWIEPVRRIHRADPTTGIVGSSFREWNGSGPNAFMQARYPDWSDQLGESESHEVDWVEGSAMFIRRECWQDVGPFDPNYFIFWDEAEYCRRARQHNWKVVMALDSVVEHFGGGSVHSDSSFRKPLMQTNCYAYKLTNPERSFTANMGQWMRLVLTESRQVLRASQPLSAGFSWGQNVAKTAFSLPTLYRRYRGHRTGAPLTRTDGRFSKALTDLSIPR